MAGRRTLWIALTALAAVATTAWAASGASRRPVAGSIDSRTDASLPPTALRLAPAARCLAAAPAPTTLAVRGADPGSTEVTAALLASLERARARARLDEIRTRVDVIDARSGAPVPGARWRSPFIVPTEVDWLPSGAVGSCLRTRRPAVDLPKGWATFEEGWLRAPVPEGFVEGRARVLAFPEANVRVVLNGADEFVDGTRLEISYAFVDGEPAEGVRDEVGLDGVHRVKRIPFRPNGALLLVLDCIQTCPPADAWKAGDSQEAEITILPDVVRVVRATLPRIETETLDLLVDVTALPLVERPYVSGGSGLVRYTSGEEEATEAERGPGAELDVLVRDGQGHPAPFAHLEVTGRLVGEYADLDGDGLLQLDPYADALGRRVFHRVPSGEVHVVARYRGRRAESRFEVRAGERRVLTLTLPE